MNNQKMSVNIVPGISAPSALHASEGDVGRTCEIIIIDGTSAYNIPSTATVTITATKPSGMGFTQTCTVTDNGTAMFETTASMTDESGKMEAEVRIVDGGKNIGTANLLWIVERNPHPSNVIDGDVERAKTILERAEEAMAKAEQMIEEVEIYNSIVEEVEDTRVGVDGTAYDSAGDAVRGQIIGLKNDLDTHSNRFELFTEGTKTASIGIEGYYLAEKGVLKPYSGWSTTEYIYCNGLKVFHIKMPRDGRRIAFYDDTKESPLAVYVLDSKTEKDHITPDSDGWWHVPVPQKAIYVMTSEADDKIDEILFEISEVTFYKENSSKGIYYNGRVITGGSMRSINRLGLKTDAPEQSIIAYKAAVEAGFKVLLCDLSYTADNHGICFHDKTINRIARNEDGTTISQTIDVTASTLQELNAYDYGIYKGEAFAGTKILRIEDMLKFCKNVGVELYIEMKYCTEEQVALAVKTVSTYGMQDCVSWACHFRDTNNQKYQCQWVINNNPYARVALMTEGDGITGTSGYKDWLLSFKTGLNSVFAFNWNTESLTDDEISWMIDNDISYEIGTINSKKDIIDYCDRIPFCTGIESDTIVASNVLRENALS